MLPLMRWERRLEPDLLRHRDFGTCRRAFDQVLQFAAIRTDDDLNEIGRFEIRSRLLPYIIPSPHAMQVTGQTIDDLLDEDPAIVLRNGD